MARKTISLAEGSAPALSASSRAVSCAALGSSSRVVLGSSSRAVPPSPAGTRTPTSLGSSPCSGGFPPAASEAWKQEVLWVHNELRARHHAPPLRWSDECYSLADTHAQQCAASKRLDHGNTRGASGVHGQNIGVGTDSPCAVVTHWYLELLRWTYDFDVHDGAGPASSNQMCEHFTQIVWVDTEFVGMAFYKGHVVANYFPAGNRPKKYRQNVLPVPVEVLRTHFPCRTAWTRVMTPELDGFLRGLGECIPPDRGGSTHDCLMEAARAFAQDAAVRVIIENGEVSICVRAGQSYNRYRWGLLRKYLRKLPPAMCELWEAMPKAHVEFRQVDVPPRLIKERAREVFSTERMVRHAFARVSGSEDGNLNLVELAGVMGVLGMEAEESHRLSRAADKNGDGLVDLWQFLSWLYSGTKKAKEALEIIVDMEPMTPEEEAVRKAFDEADENEDGYLQPDELGELLESIGMSRQSVKRLMGSVDVNGDGKVDLNEFVSWIFSDDKQAALALKRISE